MKAYTKVSVNIILNDDKLEASHLKSEKGHLLAIMF